MGRVASIVIAVVLLLAAGTAVAAQQLPWREPLEPVRDTASITVGNDQLDVELSISPAQQTLGLGYRNGLPDGRGMLFVNDSAEPRTFWMKGMRFCIDIVWIEDGEITGAAESVCPDPAGTPDGEKARYPSDTPVTYVLELPAGWLASHGYGAGTPVQIPDHVQSAIGS